MWTRKELKQRGMKCFRLNFWKTVLVALIASFLVGSTSGFSGAAAGGSGLTVNVPPNNSYQASDSESEVFDAEADGISPNPATVFAVAAVILIVFLVILAVIILIRVILLNPLEIGTKRFFVANLHMPAEVREVAFGYDHAFRNNVRTLFFRDLYTFLWSLLFIIPGIVKAYEYRMIPYILAEHPETDMKDAFAQSRTLMTGQKWRAFILDLSFLGWEILSLFTMGLLEIFYVGPYRNMTNAALYEALVYGNRQEETTVWTES